MEADPLARSSDENIPTEAIRVKLGSRQYKGNLNASIKLEACLKMHALVMLVFSNAAVILHLVGCKTR